MRANKNENARIRDYVDMDKILATVAPDDLSYYGTEESSALLEKISRVLLHNATKPSAITLTCGADDALLRIFDKVCPASTEVISVYPFYSCLRDVLRQRRIQLARINVAMKQFDHDGEYILRIVDDCLNRSADKERKVVYLTNPNNPTGHKYEPEAILALARKHRSACFIIDESYIEYMDYKKSVAYVASISEHDNVFVLRSFSKIFGLAGMRLGYVISGCKFDYPPKLVNNAAVKYASALVDRFDDILRMRDDLQANRTKFVLSLANSGITAYATDANMTNVYMGPAAKRAITELANDKEMPIIVKDMQDAYGMYGYIRVSDVSRPAFEHICRVFARVARDEPSNQLIPIDNFAFGVRRRCLLYKLYEAVAPMLDDIDKYCHCRISITCGTAIGFVRNHDIILWDDDIDLMYYGSLELLGSDAVAEIARKHGITMKLNRTGAYWQVWRDDIAEQPGVPASTNGASDIHIDIFPYVLIDGKYVNNDTRFRVNIDGQCNPVIQVRDGVPSSFVCPMFPMHHLVNVPCDILSILNTSLDPDFLYEAKLIRDGTVYEYPISANAQML